MVLSALNMAFLRGRASFEDLFAVLYAAHVRFPACRSFPLADSYSGVRYGVPINHRASSSCTCLAPVPTHAREYKNIDSYIHDSIVCTHPRVSTHMYNTNPNRHTPQVSEAASFLIAQTVKCLSFLAESTIHPTARMK